jgi:hypothetical protein
MAVSKAHIKASNKYNAQNYKKIQANIKPEDYDFIDNFCKSTGINKAQLIVKAIRYCIEHDIQLQ